MLSAAGQNVDLPATATRKLELLVLASYGTQTGEFRVTYQDGSSANFARSVSDWWESALHDDEDYGAASAYYWSSSDQAKHCGNFHMFVHTLPLDPAKVPRTLTLPNNGRIKVFALTANTLP